MTFGSSPSTRLAPSLRWRVLLLLILPTTILLATGGFTDDKHKQRKLGVVYLDCEAIGESSGIALSTRDAQVVWTHNDSGDRARVFALNRIGKLVAEVHVDGAKSLDWEDMCSFERNGQHWLAVGDVGDNDVRRKSVVIYVIEEPQLPDRVKGRLNAKVAMELNVRYPDGPLNCEALAYDPLQEKFVLCSKETFRTRLFEVKMPKEPGRHEIVAEQFGVLAVPIVTGADISRDGQRLILATYGPGGLLQRTAASGGSDAKWNTADTHLFRAVELPARRQGESVCFDLIPDSLILTSEGEPAPLLFSTIPDSRKLP